LSGEWKGSYNEGAIEKEYFMYNNSSNGTRAAPTRGFAALCAVLAMGLALAACPAEAAPFLYVANGDTVSVIDTATNTVVGLPIPVGTNPIGVAVTPDGRKVYVTNIGPPRTSSALSR
jgi:YVTN family beta-propeller protein